MTRDDIVRMAQDAGIMPPNWGATENQWRSLEAFAKLVAEHERKEFATQAVDIARRAVMEEREACAKLCEKDGLLWGQRYAAAIRAMSET